MRVASRLYLHIGTQKSGTTYLQRILERLSPALAQQGVLYPTWTSRGDLVYNHEPATYGLLGPAEYPWIAERVAEVQRKPWARLVDHVTRWQGSAIVSGEAMSVIRPDAVRRLVDALGVRETVVVITTRDLGRVLPSSWQQSIRNGRSGGFDYYLTAIARQRGGFGIAADPTRWDDDIDHTFWRAYAIGTLVQRWGAVVGAANVRVVGVPRPRDGEHALWRRFVAATELGGVAPDEPPAISTLRANVGLTEPEVLLLAAFNKEAEQRGVSRADSRAARMALIKDHLVSRTDRGTPVRLSGPWFERATEWAHEDRDILMASGCTYVGAPDDLLPDAADVAAGPAPVDDLVRAAAAALAGSIWPSSRGEGTP